MFTFGILLWQQQLNAKKLTWTQHNLLNLVAHNFII